VIVEQWGGVPFEQPYRKVRDVNRLVQEMLRGDKVVAEHETVRSNGFRLSRRLAPAPPVYIAALREGMLRLAGAESDGAIINWLSAGDVPQCVAAAKDGARKAGRDPDKLEVVCRIFVCMIEDENVIDFLGRRMIAAYLNVPVYAAFHEWLGRGPALEGMWDNWKAGDRKAATAAIERKTIDELVIWGDAATCRRKVQEYVDNGVTVPVLNFIPVAPDAAGRAAQSVGMLRALAPR
jgi:alkanesulfonate monooxygenase SsuD/methylene tetrahydromethanopterin reductase-like flavin-dependent oxidoreductase (luciferase family)